MAAGWKQWIERIGWTRVIVAVVLLGLSSLVVSALVASSGPAPQQASETPILQQEQTAVSAVNTTPETSASFAEVSMRGTIVQTGSTALHGRSDSGSRGKPSPASTHSTPKGQTQKMQHTQTKPSSAKGLKPSATKGKSTKATANKARSSKQIKHQSPSTLPSDTLFPELRRK